jgi:hypothetical protein
MRQDTIGDVQAGNNGNALETTNGTGAKLDAGFETPRGAFSEFKVCDVHKGREDCRGEQIEYVYFKRESYAIYKSGGKILIQYSDGRDEALKQIAALAELIPVRDRLQYLTSGTSVPDCYQWQIAEALRLGLDGQVEAAKRTLEAATQDVMDTRARAGRMAYLLWAGPIAAGVAGLCLLFGIVLIIFIVGTPLKAAAPSVGHLLLATGAGAVGALLSISIGLRARTVALDGDMTQNGIDATVRVLIGVISAGVLYLFIASGVLGNVLLGDMKISEARTTWHLAVLVGFAAGFLERLVPDLLEKKMPAPAAPVNAAKSAN